MAKNPLIRSFSKRVNQPLPNKSAGILDDYAVRKVVATKEGSITRTPTADIDIANKAYVDSNDFWQRVGTILSPKTAGDGVETTGHVTSSSSNITKNSYPALTFLNSDTSISDGQTLGSIFFKGEDSAQRLGAEIRVRANNGWGSGGIYDAPTAIGFFPQQNNAASAPDALMVIDGDNQGVSIGVEDWSPGALLALKGINSGEQVFKINAANGQTEDIMEIETYAGTNLMSLSSLYKWNFTDISDDIQFFDNGYVLTVDSNNAGTPAAIFANVSSTVTIGSSTSDISSTSSLPWRLANDNKALELGAASDSNIVFTGTSLNINSNLVDNSNLLKLNPDTTGASPSITIFQNVKTGDRPQLLLYGYADSIGTPAAKYASMYVDTWGRLTFGGSTQSTIFNNDLTVSGIGDFLVFPSYDRYGIGTVSSQASASMTPMFKFFDVDTGTTSTSAIIFARSTTYDYGHAFSYNPKIYLHSNSSSQTEWLSLEHDQTNPVLDWGSGELNLYGGDVSVPKGHLQVSGDASEDLRSEVFTNHATLNDTAGLGFGVHTGTPRVMKSALIHQRKGSYGQGELVIAVDANTDANDVTISDEVLRLKSDGATEGKKFKFTSLGGYAIKITNKTGANSVAGQLVKASTTTNDAVALAGAGDVECFGVFLDSGIADGSEAWAVVSGIADVALDDNVAAVRGNWMATGVAAGYARTSASPAAAPGHFDEIGHCVESVAAGGAGTHILARCVIHFN